jgi:hypothetical protein
LGEGNHQAREPHLLLRRILSDRKIQALVDVVIVEFATARFQETLDAYIRGEDVPFESLNQVWRNTSTSPVVPWESPLYLQMLEVIRAGNQDLPLEQQVRVIAGDPPIDWDRIKTREDFAASSRPRDPYVAAVAMEQAFQFGKRVLIIFGGAHLPKAPVATGDPRNSLTHRIVSQHPDSVKAIEFFSPENLRVMDRIDELEMGRIYSTAGHWLGDIEGALFFQEVYSRITDPLTGQNEWKKVPLYSEFRVRDLFDALIYLGPSRNWKIVRGSLDPEQDKAYLDELDRRSLLRFGRSWNSRR